MIAPVFSTFLYMATTAWAQNFGGGAPTQFINQTTGTTTTTTTLAAVSDPTYLEHGCVCGTSTTLVEDSFTVPVVAGTDEVRVITATWSRNSSTTCPNDANPPPSTAPHAELDNVDMTDVDGAEGYSRTSGGDICGAFAMELDLTQGNTYELDYELTSSGEILGCYWLIQEPSGGATIPNGDQDTGKGNATTNSSTSNASVAAQVSGDYGFLVVATYDSRLSTIADDSSPDFVERTKEDCSTVSMTIHMSDYVWSTSEDVMAYTSWTTNANMVSWYGQW